MQSESFKDMWNEMQRQGYFRDHPHYVDWHNDHQDALASDPDLFDLNARPEPMFEQLDVTKNELIICDKISPDIERVIKRNEHYWLPRMFELPPSGTVLDLGCGYGRSLDWLHKIYGKSIGIDISEYIIDVAKKRFASVDTVYFYSCDGCNFPEELAEKSVDLIYCFTVFQHIPRNFTLNYLKECHRIIKSDGKIIFNLLSGMNEEVNDGVSGTEWAIGYSRDQAEELVNEANLKVSRIVTWRAANMDACWLWVEVCPN